MTIFTFFYRWRTRFCPRHTRNHCTLGFLCIYSTLVYIWLDLTQEHLYMIWSLNHVGFICIQGNSSVSVVASSILCGWWIMWEAPRHLIPVASWMELGATTQQSTIPQMAQAIAWLGVFIWAVSKVAASINHQLHACRNAAVATEIEY